ncbi:MAG: hypothetical protein ACMUJM_02145 [bacterium]
MPPLSTFQAPILDNKYRIILPSFSLDMIPLSDIVKAQQIVVNNLSSIGIIKTLEKIIYELPYLPYQQNGSANRELLEEIGIPIKLLSCYRCENPKIEGLDQIISILQNKAAVLKEREFMDIKWQFSYTPTLPGFKLLPENGVGKIYAFRLQIPSIHYITGPGDGCAIDIVRQLLLTTNDELFLISLSPDNIIPFNEMIQLWRVFVPERILLLEDETVSSQWAQDNCKPGALYNAQGEFLEYVTLIPRFASAGEKYSEYRPAESFIFDQVQGAGWHVVQSPLLFQGGDIIPVRNMETNELLVFVGEAEVARNKELGLSEEEVLQAFGREWGADRIEVIPSLSFHIDLEMSFRWHKREMIAYVNDSLSAARLIIKSGIKRLYSCNLLTGQETEQLLYWLEHSFQEDQMIQILWDKINELFLKDGRFSGDTVELFKVSEEEVGDLNFSRFLLALDIVTASQKEGEQFWRKLKDHYLGEGALSYFASLLEREQKRNVLKNQLLMRGMKVIPLPSISHEELSLNYLNAVHDLGAVYLPSFGGLFQELDEKVIEIIKNSLGNTVKIHLIRNSQTQFDCGGIHCSLSTYSL